MQNEYSGNTICNAFSVVPSAISDSVKYFLEVMLLRVRLKLAPVENLMDGPGNYKGGSIIVLLTSCLSGLD
jgi:hypothetical protein